MTNGYAQNILAFLIKNKSNIAEVVQLFLNILTEFYFFQGVIIDI